MLFVAIPKIAKSHLKQQSYFTTIQSIHTCFLQYNLRKINDMCDCLALLKDK